MTAVGSDAITSATPLGFGTSSDPTPTAGLTIEQWEKDTFWFNGTRSAWWTVEVPTSWTGADIMRFDCMQMTPPASRFDLNPVIIVANGPDPTADGFDYTLLQGLQFGSAADNRIDKDYTGATPGQTLWVGMLLSLSSIDTEYLLRVGKLLETFPLTDPAQDPPVSVCDGPFGEDLVWGVTLPASGVAAIKMSGNPVDVLHRLTNFEPAADNHYEGHLGTSSIWDYLVAGFFDTDGRPVPSSVAPEMLRKTVWGTGVDHGSDYNYGGAGDPYPEGRWRYNEGYDGSWLYSCDRKDWAAGGDAGEGFDSIVFSTSHSAALAANVVLPAELDADDVGAGRIHDTNFETARSFVPGFGYLGWVSSYRPDNTSRGGSGATPPDGATGLTFGQDGQVLSRTLHVAVRTKPGSYVESSDRLLLGHLALGTEPATWPNAVANMTLIASLPIPNVPTDPIDLDHEVGQAREFTFFSITLPDGFDSGGDGQLIAVVSPAVTPGYESRPTETGLVAVTYTDTWGWRLASQHVYPDSSTTSRGLAATIMWSTEYYWQPPTYQWRLHVRETASDALLADFTWVLDASGRLVHFDASGSLSVGAATITDYTWDFGEVTLVPVPEQPTTGEFVDHQFYSLGPFEVTLTVTDSNGATASVVHTVDLAPSAISGDYDDDRCSFSGAS